MSDIAVIKASQLQSVLEEVERLPPGPRGAIREAAGPEALGTLADAVGSDWLPFALELRLSHAVHDALGPDGAHRFFREHQLRAFSSPTFRFLVDGATKLFGLDPGSWARWIPRGWGLVFRGCGRWVTELAAAGEVQLGLIDPPAGEPRGRGVAGLAGLVLLGLRRPRAHGRRVHARPRRPGAADRVVRAPVAHGRAWLSRPTPSVSAGRGAAPAWQPTTLPPPPASAGRSSGGSPPSPWRPG
jgi:hypothetical protein